MNQKIQVSEKAQNNLQSITDYVDQQTGQSFNLNLKTLPKSWTMVLLPQPKKLQLPILVSLLPLNGAYASDVEVEYCDGKKMHLDLMAVIEAGQAGSKGACRDVQYMWLKPMMSDDCEARAIEERWRKKNRGRKASERAEEDPAVVVRHVPITISNATLLRRLKNAKGKTLYSFSEELDTVLKTNRAGAWSQKTDCYRYAFDRGLWGQDFNSDQSESGLVPVAYNWTVCGTLGAIRRFFKNENVENGLAGRTLPADTGDQAFEKMPKYKPFPEGTQEAVEEDIAYLRSLGGFVDTPRLRKAIDRWSEEKRLEALADDAVEKDIFRRRAGVIGFRAGVIHHLLMRKATESNASVNFALLIADYCLYQQLRLWGQQLRAALDENIQPAYYESGNTRLFDKLEDIFTLADLAALKCEGTKDSSLRTIVYRWKKAGWIVALEKGKYQKVKH